MLSNLFVVVTYGMVGWYLADYQVRRYAAERFWSLSGVSLVGVFFTCALMHLIYATTERHAETLPFDLFGIPASIYFLWIVKRVHSDSVVDWNRRPLVGAAATPERSSPWSGSNLTRPG
jgi:surface polysaccharide O-acyltransferase-like enzyme